jgi:hypothetical protein
VVGDRHEVHAAALGQRVDLLGRRGALGSPTLRWMPSFDTADAVEWQCMSTRVIDEELFVCSVIDLQNHLQTRPFCIRVGNIV